MSFVRMGMPCWASFNVGPNAERDDKLDQSCKKCPGSELYIFRGGKGYVCCFCHFKKGLSWETHSLERLYRHIIRHDKKGHHTIKSLVLEAKEYVEKKKP